MARYIDTDTLPEGKEHDPRLGKVICSRGELHFRSDGDWEKTLAADEDSPGILSITKHDFAEACLHDPEAKELLKY